MRFRQNKEASQNNLKLITVKRIETPLQFLNHKTYYNDNRHVYKIKQTTWC